MGKSNNSARLLAAKRKAESLAEGEKRAAAKKQAELLAHQQRAAADRQAAARRAADEAAAKRSETAMLKDQIAALELANKNLTPLAPIKAKSLAVSFASPPPQPLPSSSPADNKEPAPEKVNAVEQLVLKKCETFFAARMAEMAEINARPQPPPAPATTAISPIAAYPYGPGPAPAASSAPPTASGAGPSTTSHARYDAPSMLLMANEMKQPSNPLEQVDQQVTGVVLLTDAAIIALKKVPADIESAVLHLEHMNRRARSTKIIYGKIGHVPHVGLSAAGNFASSQLLNCMSPDCDPAIYNTSAGEAALSAARIVKAAADQKAAEVRPNGGGSGSGAGGSGGGSGGGGGGGREPWKRQFDDHKGGHGGDRGGDRNNKYPRR